MMEQEYGSGPALAATLLDYVSEAIFAYLPGAELQPLNAAAGALFGAAAATYHGMSLLASLTHDQQPLELVLAQLEPGAAWSGTITSTTPGETRFFDVRIHSSEPDGRRIITASDTTPVHALKAALQRSQKRFRTLVEGIADCAIIFLTCDGRISDINRCGTLVDRIEAEALLGQHLSILFPFEQPDLAPLAAALETVRPTERIEIETWLPHRTGAEVRAKIVLVPMYDQDRVHRGFVNIIYDVSAQYTTQRALQSSEARLRGIISSAMEAIIITDEHQDIVMFNAAAEQMFRYEQKQVRTQSLRQLFAPRCWGLFQEAIARVNQAGAPAQRLISTLYAQRANGEEFPIEATLSRLYLDGETTYTLILNDVTQRRKAEARLAHFTRRLQGLRELDRSLLTTLDPQMLARIAICHLRQMVPFGQGYLLQFNNDREQVEVLYRYATITPCEQFTYATAAPVLELHTNQYLISNDLACASQRSSLEELLAKQAMRSYLAVPLVSGMRPIGCLILASYQPQTFNMEHIGLTLEVADQIALVLQQSYLNQELQSSRQGLQVLSRRLVEIQEVERRTIARELHDEIGQSLTGLKFIIDLISRSASGAEGAIQEARQIVHELLQRVHNLALDLRPAMLDDFGLLPALIWLVERYTSQTAIQVDFCHRGLDRRLGPNIETSAYRIVQEALTNTARYAQTNAVTVSLLAQPPFLTIDIADQGVGFDMDGVASTSIGLRGIRERVAALNGSFSIQTAPGAGTRLLAVIPIELQEVLP